MVTVDRRSPSTGPTDGTSRSTRPRSGASSTAGSSPSTSSSTPRPSPPPSRDRRPPIALVHDYLTQQGGAERVVLTLADAYPGAVIHTSLYDPGGHVPRIPRPRRRTLPLDRIGLLRDHHRLALPLLAPAFSHLHVDADVTICSSSGWAHGAPVTGAKIVYCHNPARWLYQRDQYLDGSSRLAAAGLALLTPPLGRWDRRAAATADRYLVNSRAVRARVADAYGIDAQVVPPPVDIDVGGPAPAPDGVEPGFVLCVSRLLALQERRGGRRGVRPHAGTGGSSWSAPGPQAEALTAAAPANVTFLGRVADDELRWLYGAVPGSGGRLLRGLRPHADRGGRLRAPHRRPPLGRVPRHHRGGDDRACSSTSRPRTPSPPPSTNWPHRLVRDVARPGTPVVRAAGRFLDVRGRRGRRRPPAR